MVVSMLVVVAGKLGQSATIVTVKIALIVFGFKAFAFALQK